MDGEKFFLGDIVRNVWVGEGNPYRYLLYLGKGTIRQGRYRHKAYNCIGYDGSKVQLFRDEPSIEKVGHMVEYDKFITALKALREGAENG